MKRKEDLEDKLIISLVILGTGIGLFLLVISIKNVINMMIYNECLKQNPQVFLNHPVCKKYKDY